jgi:hypothetical protein
MKEKERMEETETLFERNARRENLLACSRVYVDVDVLVGNSFV